MNEQTTTLATFRRWDSSRFLEAAELRVDLDAGPRPCVELARHERAGGKWRKTSKAIHFVPKELDALIDALQRAKELLKGDAQ